MAEIQLPALFQTAAVANGNGNTMSVGSLDGVGIQITGITTATVNFEVTIDGTNWYTFRVMNASGAFVTTATADGFFYADVRGAQQLRCRISGWSVGTITITGSGIYK